jgi:hypothetical protein
MFIKIGTDAPLGSVNRNLPDTPSGFTCPPLTPPSHSGVVQPEETVGSRIKSTLSNVYIFLTSSLGIIPAEDPHLGRGKTKPIMLPHDYVNNKWVNMGKGEPTVLPLFHGCSSKTNVDSCSSAVDRTNLDISQSSCSRNHSSSRKDDRNAQYLKYEDAIREQPTNL